MKPTVNRISTPSVKMSDSESKIIIMTESNVGSQAFWIIITGETNESLGSIMVKSRKDEPNRCRTRKQVI